LKSLVPNFGYIAVLAFFALAGPFFLERFGRRALLWLTVVTVCLAAFVAASPSDERRPTSVTRRTGWAT